MLVMERVEWCIIILIKVMQLTNEGLKLLCKGSNSEIYLYGTADSKVVLKVVPASCTKEAKHLGNEYGVLSKLHHDNVIRALKYKEKISLTGTGSTR